MDFLRKWIINIVITIIFVSFVEIIMPEGSMRKYISLVIGLLVMIVIINPLLNLAAGEFDMGDRVMEMASAIDIEDTRLQVQNLEEGQRESIIQVYKSRLEKQIVRQVVEENLAKEVSAEVDIDDDFKSDGFGEIKGIRIVVYDVGNGSDRNSGEIEVEKVEISVGKHPGTETVNAASRQGEEMDDRISAYLAQIFRISPDRIEVISNKP